MFRSIASQDSDCVILTPKPSSRAGTAILLASPEDLDSDDDQEPVLDCAKAPDAKVGPKRSWLLTVFDDDKSLLIVKFMSIEEHIQHYVMGLETCPSTGRPHIHVAVRLREPQRISFWRKLFEPTSYKWNAKWCLDSKYENFMRYCKKEDKNPDEFGDYKSKKAANRLTAEERKRKLEGYRMSAAEGKLDDIPEAEYRVYHKYYDRIAKKGKYDRLHENYKDYVEGEWANRTYKVWQKSLLKELESDPDNRSIFWVYDSQGGAGKSSFARHIELKYDCQVIIPAKSTDIAFALEPGKAIYCLDIPRTMGEHVPWGFLESLKNGLYLNPKYESTFVHMRPPHVVVMCNAPPPEVDEKHGFSEDRIKLITI